MRIRCKHLFQATNRHVIQTMKWKKSDSLVCVVGCLLRSTVVSYNLQLCTLAMCVAKRKQMQVMRMIVCYIGKKV